MAPPFTLSCPSCGAPAASPDAARCEYCGLALTTVSCPSCFGMMFAGMQFCPHCGAKGARAIADAGTILVCPGCQGSMRGIEVGATPMFECASCASVWLDAGTFSQLCLDREERGTVASKIARAPVGVIPTAGRQVRYVRCPVCKNTLNRENFGRQSGVIIDVCKSDGVWFERGELHSVLAFIEGGGLERSRVIEEQRKSEERRKLEEEFSRASLRIAHEAYSVKITTGRTSSGPLDSLLSDALKALFSA